MDEEYRCHVCGSTRVKLVGNVFVCESCGCKRISSAELAKQDADLKRAWDYFYQILPDFDNASEAFQKVINSNPECADAYWGKLLASSGIKLVYDNDVKKICPTCFKNNLSPIQCDQLFDNACACATDEQKAEYIKIANEIEEVSKKMRELLKDNSYKFDVFIAYANKYRNPRTGEEIITGDADLAEHLYNSLREKNFRVFFAPEINTIFKKSHGYNPEALIYTALMNSTCMVVLGSKPEYFENDWVKNEWQRFIYRMDVKQEKNLYLTCLSPDENVFGRLPDTFKHSQNILITKTDKYIDTLVKQMEDYIDRKPTIDIDDKLNIASSDIDDMVPLRKKERKKINQISKQIETEGNKINRTESKNEIFIPNSTASLDEKIVDGFSLLSGGNLFSAALDRFNEVLDEQADNVKALYGAFLAEHKCHSIKDMPDKVIEKLTSHDYYILTRAIKVYSYDDKNDTEFHIIERIYRFIREKIDNYKVCILPLKEMRIYHENKVVIKMVQDIVEAVLRGEKHKVSNDEDYYEFVLLVASSVSNQYYKTVFQDLIKKYFDLNAIELCKKLLEEYKKTVGENGFYLSYNLKCEYKIKTLDELLTFFIDSNEYSQLQKIIFSTGSLSETNKYFEALVKLLKNEIVNGKDLSEKALPLAKFIFQFDFDNSDRRLTEVVREYLSRSTKNGSNELFVELTTNYLNPGSTIAFVKQRIDFLIRNNQHKKACDLIDLVIEAYPNLLRCYYLKLDLLLKTNILDRAPNINEVLKLNLKQDLFDKIVELTYASKDNNDFEKLAKVFERLCNVCIFNLQGSTNKVNKILECFDVFLSHIPYEYKTKKRDLLESLADKLLKNGYFDQSKTYIFSLVTHVNKSLDEEKLEKKAVDYYIMSIQAKARKKTKIDLIRSYPAISDANVYPEWNAILRLVTDGKQYSEFYKKQRDEFINKVVNPQARYIKRHPLSTKFKDKKSKRK